MVKAYDAFKDKGFTVLGVSLDKDTGQGAWVKAIAADGLGWHQVSDRKSWQYAAAQQDGIEEEGMVQRGRPCDADTADDCIGKRAAGPALLDGRPGLTPCLAPQSS